MKEAKEYYERMGCLAKSKGVTINVINIEEDCNFSVLETLCDKSGGMPLRVDALTVKQAF